MKELEVKLYGRLLGTITRDDRTHETRLTYATEYLEDPRTVALSAGLPKQAQPIAWERAGRWFDGLLPEGERRARIAREVGAARMSTYSMLEAMGAECAGAVTVTPRGYEPAPWREPAPVAEIAAEIGRLKLAQGSTRTRGARLSLAGAQEKFALSRDEAGRWYFPMDGYPSSHIVKPEGARFPGIAGNEHTCMELARRSGLEAAETEVGTFGEHKALVVKRFDRKEGGGKLHQEDFCQALGRMGKYQQDPDGPSLKALFTKGPVGGWALWDQVMFAWLIGDEDKHAKNVSVLYPEDGSVRLSPVYDAVCTMRYGGLERGMAWKIGNTYHANAVTERGIGVQATRCGLDPNEAVHRLHGLAERMRTAKEDMRREGWDMTHLDAGGVDTRMERAGEWAGRGLTPTSA